MGTNQSVRRFHLHRRGQNKHWLRWVLYSRKLWLYWRETLHMLTCSAATGTDIGSCSNAVLLTSWDFVTFWCCSFCDGILFDSVCVIACSKTGEIPTSLWLLMVFCEQKWRSSDYSYDSITCGLTTTVCRNMSHFSSFNFQNFSSSPL